HVEPASALVSGHEEIAAKKVLPQQAPAGAGPKVEPAVMDVQNEGAAGVENAINVLEALSALGQPFNQAQGTEQTGGVIERGVGQLLVVRSSDGGIVYIVPKGARNTGWKLPVGGHDLAHGAQGQQRPRDWSFFCRSHRCYFLLGNSLTSNLRILTTLPRLCC